MQVCSPCLGENEYFRTLIAEQNVRGKCTFCGKKDLIINYDEVLEIVNDAMERFFVWADGDLPYDPEDDEYLGTTYYTDDAVQDLFMRDPSQGHYEMKVIDELVRCLDEGQLLCDRYWRGDDYDSIMENSWSDFCEYVKHNKRFFYHLHDAPIGDDFDIFPSEMLEAIVAVVSECNLIKPVDIGQLVFRARTTANKPIKGKSHLGSAPLASASASRMSPAGIPHFYGAFDTMTAIKETLPKKYTGIISHSSWEITRELKVIDFSIQLELPSIFDGSKSMLYDVYGFLRGFLQDIAKPITKDNQEHIEYAPTQLISEYIRTKLPDLDGIIFKSSRANGICLVLFPQENDRPESGRLLYKKADFTVFCNGQPIRDQKAKP